MTAEVAPDSGRARPQSGGFRTFLSWLKRDDKLHERSSSVESVSSDGSDRTVTSFAFFGPNHYRANVEPVTVPPPGSPTDSYRKRIQDRNLRLHLDRDRDLTLCRKYHLTADPSHYEAFSLPTRHDREDRARRATSVCLQRRAPYVPGKRHAPAPPVRASSLGPMNTQSIKRVRKRQAPPPPIVNVQQNIEVNRILNISTPSNSETNNFFSRKEKVKNKMDGNFRRNSSERSFLKQIFEGKKKISVFDPVAVRLLPSISELDRQAAEIIQMRLRNEKIKDDVTNVETMTVAPIEDTTSNINVVGSTSVTEKEDLKRLLKEMKDSLPKRPKPTKDVKTNIGEIKPSTSNSNRETSVCVLDNNNKWHWSPLISQTNKTPLQNISILNGSDVEKQKNLVKNKVQTTEPQISEYKKPTSSAETKSSTDLKQSAPFQSNKTVVSIKMVSKEANSNDLKHVELNTDEKTTDKINVNESTSLVNLTQPKESINLNDQRLPQLLMLPEIKITKEKIKPELLKKEKETVILSTNSQTQPISLSNTAEHYNTKEKIEKLDKNKLNLLPTSSQTTVDVLNVNKTSTHITEKTGIKLEQTHKDLITILEECILKGDEIGAAKAATQLAQLRVSGLGLSSLLNTGVSGDIEINKTNKESEIIVTPDICHVRNQTFDKETTPNSHNNKTTNSTISPPRRRKNSIPDVIPSTSSKTNLHNEIKIEKDAKKYVDAIDNNTANTHNAKLKLIHDNKDIVATSSKLLLEKVNINASTSNDTSNTQDLVRVEVWVEDRKTARGPVGLHVSRDWNLARLRKQAEISLGLPMRLQRWIVGNNLCSDDNALLEVLAGKDFKAPFYLCLLDSELNKKAIQEYLKEAQILDEPLQETNKIEEKSQNVYKELMELEQQALVSNVEGFECGVCLEPCAAGDGAVLRDCIHSFCRGCLADAVRHCQEPQVSCPSGGCTSQLQDREIRALVTPADFERWLERGLAAAESGSRGAFHCRTPDCAAWALVDPGVRTFPCSRCGVTSCVACQAIHEGMTCDQYRSKQAQETAKLALEGKVEDEGTRALLDTLIERGEALPCPECNTIITKKWGCDWVRCSACKTEICWITRGRRWGPAGRGDTSAGCRCGVDGKRCHPSCAYCH